MNAVATQVGPMPATLPTRILISPLTAMNCAGENLLAIHGLNISKESSDMLIEASLAWSDFNLEKALQQIVDEQAFYRFWTLEGLLSFWDGYSGNRNNFFFTATCKLRNCISCPGAPIACFKNTACLVSIPIPQDRFEP